MGLTVLVASASTALPQASGVGQISTGTASAAPAADAGLIVGRVVDGDSGAPVADALVTLVLYPAPVMPANVSFAEGFRLWLAARTAPPRPAVTVIADNDGWFAFPDLPAGRCTVTAIPPGTDWGDASSGAEPSSTHVNLLRGQRLGGVLVRTWKQLGSISGVLTDAAGDPIVGAPLRVLRRAVVGGSPTFERVVGTTDWKSDDRGVFRAFGFGPGDYVVCLTSLARALDPGPLLAAPPTCYPAAATAEQATAIALQSGDDRAGVDFSVTLSPTVRVSGSVTSPAGPAGGIGVHIIAADPNQAFDMDRLAYDEAVTVSDAQGRFTFPSVPRGDFVVEAVGMSGQHPELSWAAQPLSVEGVDAVGPVELPLQPAPQLSGRVVLEEGPLEPGSAREPTAAQLERLNITLASIQSERASVPPSPPLSVASDGSFVSGGYLPGRYSITTPSILGWLPERITAGSADVSDVPIEVGLTGLSSLTITYTNHPAQVVGTVRNWAMAADPTALVVAFPEDPHVWGWPSGLHTATAHAADGGRYRLTLAPGDYLVAAVSDEWEGGWREPSFLQRLAAVATHVHCNKAETCTENLRTESVR